MHDHDAQIAGGDAGKAQGGEFGDRIILAIAGAAGKGDERRSPEVDLAMLGEIADGLDGKVDGAVDLADPGAAFARPGSVDERQQPQGGRRDAAIAVAVAQRELHPFIVETPLHGKPFLLHTAAKNRRGRQPERLLHHLRRIQRLGTQARRGAEPKKAAGSHDRTPCVRFSEKPHLTPHVRASAGSLRPRA